MQFENRSSAASNWQTLLFEWLDFVPDATMAERSREPTKLLEYFHPSVVRRANRRLGG